MARREHWQLEYQQQAEKLTLGQLLSANWQQVLLLVLVLGLDQFFIS